ITTTLQRANISGNQISEKLIQRPLSITSNKSSASARIPRMPSCHTHSINLGRNNTTIECRTDFSRTNTLTHHLPPKGSQPCNSGRNNTYPTDAYQQSTTSHRQPASHYAAGE